MSKLKLRLKYGDKNYLIPMSPNKTLNDLKQQVEKRFKIDAHGFRLDEFEVALEDELGDIIENPKEEMLEIVKDRRRSSGPNLGPSASLQVETLEKKVQELEARNEKLSDENERLKSSIEVAEKSEAMARESLAESEKAREEMSKVLTAAKNNPPVATRSTKVLISLAGTSSPGGKRKTHASPEPKKEATPELDPTHPHYQPKSPTPEEEKPKEEDEPEREEEEEAAARTDSKPEPEEEAKKTEPAEDLDEDPWLVVQRKMKERARKKKEKERAARAPLESTVSSPDEVDLDDLEDQQSAAQDRIRERMQARMSQRTGPRLKLEPTRARRKSAPQKTVRATAKKALAVAPTEELAESDDEHYAELSPRSKIKARMQDRMKDRVGPRKSLQPSKRAIQRQEMERRKTMPAPEKPRAKPKASGGGGAGKLSKKDAARIGRMNLQLGDKLEISGHREGILKFMGETEFAKGGMMFGLELIGGALGDHSGTVDDVSYFTCAANRGVFISAKEIRKKARKAKPKEAKRKVYRRRLVKILEEYNPAKLKAVDTLLDKNASNLHNLYVKVCSKYFQKPDKEYFDDTEVPPS